MLSYTGTFLRSLRGSLPSWQLPGCIKAAVIAAGIKKQPVPSLYRRSRGGQKIFRRIQVISRQRHEQAIKFQRGYIPNNNIKILTHAKPQEDHPLPIKTALVNIRSVGNKLDSLHEYLTRNSIGICALTETWLSDEPEPTKEVAPPAIKLYQHQEKLASGVVE